MKILIVANYNPGYFSPFVVEQMDALRMTGVEVDTYGIVGKGFFGYLKNIIGIRRKIHQFSPDLIHAHYGLSGLCANLQRQIPVITTYHGSDIHSGGWILKLSQLAIRLSSYNIFISKKLKDVSGSRQTNTCVIPCGINLSAFYSIPRQDAKERIRMRNVFVLFSSSFSNGVKNSALAKDAVAKVQEADLVELSGYNRENVHLLINAADCLLMTSHREGSPQIIKEALACGTPIVSVDVGDVREVIGQAEGCFIAERNPDDIAAKIKMALDFKGKTNGRQRIIDLGLSNDLIANKLIEVYHKVLATSR